MGCESLGVATHQDDTHPGLGSALSVLIALSCGCTVTEMLPHRDRLQPPEAMNQDKLFFSLIAFFSSVVVTAIGQQLTQHSFVSCECLRT